MNKQQIAQVSIGLQPLADQVSAYLAKKAGAPVGFVLVVATGYVQQYVSNCSRADGTMMLQELFRGWQARRADIPAHYNPGLALTAEGLQQQARELVDRARAAGFNITIEQRPLQPLAMRHYELVPVVWEVR